MLITLMGIYYVALVDSKYSIPAEIFSTILDPFAKYWDD